MLIRRERKRPSLRINKYNIMLFLTLFFSLRIDSISYIFPMGRFYYYVSILILIFLILFFGMSKSKKSITIYLTILLFALYFLSTVFHNPGNAYRAIVNFTAPLSIALLAEMNMKKKPIDFLKVLNTLFILLILIDLLTIFLFPNGMYSSLEGFYTINWFLGYKSERVRAVTLPAIAAAGILDVYCYGKPKLNFFLISTLAIMDTYLSEATSGTISCLIEFGFIFTLFFSKKNKIRKFANQILDIKILLLIIFGLNMFFAVFQAFQNNDFIEHIVVDLLDKSMTFSGRTQIWIVSLQQFMKAKIFGSGYISGSRYVMLTGIRGGTQPHNLMLALLVYTGILGLGVYSILLIFTLKQANNKMNSLSFICSAAIAANLLFGITSMNMFGQFHYAMMIILHYLSNYERNQFLRRKSL